MGASRSAGGASLLGVDGVGVALGSIGGIARARGVGGLGGVASNVGRILLSGRLDLAVELVLQSVLGKVGSLVPGVIRSGLVDLGELLLSRLNFGGGFGGSVSGNVTQENGGIADCEGKSQRSVQVGASGDGGGNVRSLRN